MNTNITIVTSFLDIKREKWQHYQRNNSVYFDNFKRLASLKYPKVIYIDEIHYDTVVEICKIYDPHLQYHKIIPYSIEKCEFYGYKDRMQQIMDTNKFEQPTCPEHSNPLYNVIMYEKLRVMNEVSNSNPFNSNVFMWMDFGFRYIPDKYMNGYLFEYTNFMKSSVRCVAFTKYINLSNMEEYQNDEYYNSHKENFIIGTFWGGDRDAISKFYTYTKMEVLRILLLGYINSDQYVFTKVYYNHPYLFDVVRCHSWQDDIMGKFIAHKKYTIGFYINGGLDYRGTSVAIYDYARGLQQLGHTPVIICNPYELCRHKVDTSVKEIYDKFSVFKMVLCSNLEKNISNIIIDNDVDIVYAIGAGNEPNVYKNRLPAKTIYHAVFATTNYVNGVDHYVTVSDYVSSISNNKYKALPHIVDFPDVAIGDLRQQLGIPKDAIVFGRYGGYDSFDIRFVWETIAEMVEQHENVYFLFASTPVLIQHPRILYLGPIYEHHIKVAFIHTCDALLHARSRGETFGLTCGEFASLGKPIITYKNSPENQHIRILGDKGIYYETKDDLKSILTTFDRTKDYSYMKDVYSDYSRDKIMDRFVKLLWY